MCGLIGCFGKNADTEWVSCEIPNLRHRGPDNSDLIKVDEFACLGSARLSMTDPNPRSNQPMRDELNGNLISFNGEIYNFRNLKSRLSSLGIQFNTESDTEVLLKGLSTFGTDFLELVNGMFAFAFYENRTKTIYLCRDNLGKKPLYYVIQNENIYWSSSMRTLQSKKIGFDLNVSGLISYLALGYTIDPFTMQDDITALSPGSILEVKVENNSLSAKEFRLPKFSTPSDLENASLREIIQAAIDSRIEGQDKVAISLSGGVDSAIVALGTKKTGKGVKTYSANFPDSDKERYNIDSSAAESIARNLGLEHERVNIFNASELPFWLDQFTKDMEEPNSNPTGLTMSYLYKRISSDGHRLVLTGDGADEILGGYPRYSLAAKIPNILHLPETLTDSVLSKATKFSTRLLTQFAVTQSKNSSISKWLYWHWVFKPEEIDKMLSIKKSYKSIKNDNLKYLSRIGQGQPNAVQSLMNFDQKIWLAMESNRKLDRISMSYSIEARSPFQDENVISKSLELMNTNKFQLLDKKILRSAYPELTNLGVRNDKTGFISPVGHWLRMNPKLVLESLERLKQTKQFKTIEIKKYTEIPCQGDYSKLKKLWSLVVLSNWLKTRDL